MSEPSLPRWLWLWLPPAWLALNLGWRIAHEPSYRLYWDSERGPEENGTFLLLAIAVACGIATLRHWRRLGAPLAVLFVAAMTAGCFYFAAEEISWGQQWFRWATPDAVKALNDQGETNLHNMSHWLDQKPRLALELWVLVAGILPPLGLDRGRRPTAGFWRWVWPPREVLPAAMMAFLVGWLERLKGPLGLSNQWPIDVRFSETQEWAYALFLMLSLLTIWLRVRRG